MGVAHQVGAAITMLKTFLLYPHFRQDSCSLFNIPLQLQTLMDGFLLLLEESAHPRLGYRCFQKSQFFFALSFPRALTIMTALFLACTQLTSPSTPDWHLVATFPGLVHTWNPERHLMSPQLFIIHHPFSNSLLSLQNEPTSVFFRI